MRLVADVAGRGDGNGPDDFPVFVRLFVEVDDCEEVRSFACLIPGPDVEGLRALVLPAAIFAMCVQRCARQCCKQPEDGAPDDSSSITIDCVHTHSCSC